MASGAMNVVISNYDSLVRDVQAIEKQSKKAVQRTISDFKSRGPGWVSQEIIKEYNIKKKDINEAKQGVRKGASRVKIAGTKVDDLAIIYRGRLLTPTHFAMRPATRPDRNRQYVVTAQIKKGEGRKPLGHRVFLAPSGSEGTKQIPFQRRGTERYPIDVIKTVSVPQMVTNEKVSENIHTRVGAELGKRLEHHLKNLVK